MPQGDDSAKSDAPKASTYQRKRQNVRRSGAQGAGGLAAQINPNYLRALPGITRSIEQLTAGKLLQSGLGLHLTDIRASGKQEVKAKGIKRKRANPITSLLQRGKNLKGVKGEFDAEELAGLDPELRKMLDHRRATSGAGGSGGGGGGGKRQRGEGKGEGKGEGRGEGSRPEGSMPAPGAGEGGGGGGGRGRVQALSGPLAPGKDAKGVFATDAEVEDAFGSDFL